MEENSEDIQRACRLGDLELLKKALESFPLTINETDQKLG